VPQVVLMCNPEDTVINQGADPLSAPQLYILHQDGLCTTVDKPWSVNSDGDAIQCATNAYQSSGTSEVRAMIRSRRMGVRWGPGQSMGLGW